MGQRSFSDLITFTRASTGTYFDGAGVLQTAAVDQPRMDYDPATGEKLGLLVEEQRTNLQVWSEEFDSASWAKQNMFVFANSLIAPDGTLTADKVGISTSTAASYMATSPGPVTAGSSYTGSIFAKRGEKSFIQLTFSTVSFGSSQYANFDLSAGLVSASVGGTADIKHVGNDWYRCTFSAVCTTTTTGTIVPVMITNGSAIRLPLYTGDDTSGIYVWGAQVEEGAFPTSYIPTTSSQVTREADVASITGTNFSDWYRQEEGTLYADYLVGTSNYPQLPVILDDATINNRIALFADSTSGGSRSVTAVVTDSSVAQASLALGTGSPQTRYKMSLAYKANDFAAVLDGGTVQTDNSGTVPVVTAAGVGSRSGGASSFLNGHIKSIKYYPKRLTDAELEALTA